MEKIELPNHIKANYLLKIKTSFISKHISISNKSTRIYSFVTYGENKLYSGFVLRDLNASILTFVSMPFMAEWYLTNSNLEESILDESSIHYYISPDVFSKNDKLYGVHIVRELNKKHNIIVRLPQK
jgi:hypothetical protein